MYIPEGFLKSQIWISFYVLMSILWLIGLKNIKYKNIPVLITSSAFSLAIMMCKMPVSGIGHLIGATFFSIILGPYQSFIVITSSLAIQSFIFGDGGITSFAANTFSIGFVASFSGYYMFKFISKRFLKKSFLTPLKTSIAAGIGGYFSIICSSLVTALILGIQPLLHYIETGASIYYPNSLTYPIYTIIIENFIIIGWVEGLFTGIAVNFLISEKSPILNVIEEKRQKPKN